MVSYEFILAVDKRGKVTIPETVRRRLKLREYAEDHPSEVRIRVGPVDEEFK